MKMQWYIWIVLEKMKVQCYFSKSFGKQNVNSSLYLGCFKMIESSMLYWVVFQRKWMCNAIYGNI